MLPASIIVRSGLALNQSLTKTLARGPQLKMTIEPFAKFGQSLRSE